jgi:hypothetical protein
MSFIPPSRGEIDREAIGGHEVDADLAAAHYTETHPDSDGRYFGTKPQILLHRLHLALRRKLSGK